MNQQKEIWTIGHSTRTEEEFLKLLQSFEIHQLVDVRRYPGSRKFPHYNKDHLEVFLPQAGIDYLHLEALGGRRKVDKNSKNLAWRLISFRAYADHMESQEFQESAETLQNLAISKRTTYMCSEAVWWSCHRALISDYLKLRDWKVNHIMDTEKAPEHPYTKPARIIDGKLCYEKEE